MRFTWIGVVAILVIVLSTGAGVARADTLQNCGDCGGGIYTLSFNPTPVSSTATTNTFAVSLAINTEAYTGSAKAFVDSIGLQLNLNPNGTATNASAVLVAAPGGAGDWFIQSGGTNSSGCNTSMANFFCTGLSDPFETSSAPSKVGGTQTWTWDITISNSQSLVTTPLGDDLKVVFMTPPDNFDHVQVSDNIGLGGAPPAAVPEPGSLALLGTGLLAFAPLIRRKFWSR